MNTPIRFTPITRPLRAISYSTRWIGTEKSLKVSSNLDQLRSHIATIRILYRAALFLSEPSAVIKKRCSHWVGIADTVHVLTSTLKNFNRYYTMSHTRSYKYLITIGAIAKIGSSTYKVFFVQMSGWKKAKHCIIITRKITFLYCSVTEKKSPTFHLTLLTISLILEVVIDARQKHK